MERYAGLSASDMSEELYPIDWFVKKFEEAFPKTRFSVLPGIQEGFSGGETRAVLSNNKPVLLVQTGVDSIWLVGSELIDTTAHIAKESWGLLEEGNDERTMILEMTFSSPFHWSQLDFEGLKQAIQMAESYVENEVQKVTKSIDRNMIKEVDVQGMDIDFDDYDVSITTGYEPKEDETIIIVYTTIVFEE